MLPIHVGRILYIHRTCVQWWFTHDVRRSIHLSRSRWCNPSRLPVRQWRMKAFTRRPDAICMNAVCKRKERKRKSERREREKLQEDDFGHWSSRSSKFRLIAPPTAPARLYSKDAFRCPNILAVNIPTRISIRRLFNIMVQSISMSCLFFISTSLHLKTSPYTQ